MFAVSAYIHNLTCYSIFNGNAFVIIPLNFSFIIFQYILFCYASPPLVGTAHNLPTTALHLSLSSTSWYRCSSPSLTFSSFMSLLIRPIHVVLGLPHGFFAGHNASINAFLAGVSAGSLSRCPSHFSLRIFIFLDHGLSSVHSYSFSLPIVCGHFICSIFLMRLRWNTSSSCSFEVLCYRSASFLIFLSVCWWLVVLALSRWTFDVIVSLFNGVLVGGLRW